MLVSKPINDRTPNIRESPYPGEILIGRSYFIRHDYFLLGPDRPFPVSVRARDGFFHVF